MTEIIYPHVRQIILCKHAELQGKPLDQEYVLTGPVTTIPPQKTRVTLWVYVQLTEGVGPCDVMLEVRYSQDDRDYRNIITPVAEQPFEFNTGTRFLPIQAAYELKQLPLKKSGLYEFRLTAGGHVLSGATAELKVREYPPGK